MGADAFHVCYGLRWEVNGLDEEEIGRLERREDPRILAARKHGLDHWWGVTTDEGRYFLLVGRLVGNFGWEGERTVSLRDADAVRITEETELKLRSAGFEDEPAWHFQFEPDR